MQVIALTQPSASTEVLLESDVMLLPEHPSPTTAHFHTPKTSVSKSPLAEHPCSIKCAIILLPWP